jgi:hypothetical protein
MNTTPQPNPSVEEVVEEFKKLGGDDEYLNYAEKDDLPTGHLTRGYHWPESKNELDPDEIIDWLRTTLTARDAAHKEAMGEMVKRLEQQIQMGADPRIAIQLERTAIARFQGVEDKQ